MTHALFVRAIALAACFPLAACLAGQAPGLTPAPRPGAGAAVYAVSGVAVDRETASPLDGADVWLSATAAPNASIDARTGADGRFAFTGLPPGKYILRARRKGYLEQGFNQHGNLFTAIVTGPGQQTENLVFRLTRASSISGKIVDEAGDPVAGAMVDLVESKTRGEPGLGRQPTADDGSYRFGHVRPGRYIIRVFARPWYAQTLYNSDDPPEAPTGVAVRSTSPLDVAFPVTYLGDVEDAAQARDIEVRPGERYTADIVLRPVPTVRIRLRVPVGEDAQRQFANVMPRGERFFGPAGVREVAPGVVEIAGLVPGQYTVTMRSARGERVPSGGTDLDVSAGGQVTLNHTPPSVPVSASVTFEGNQPPQATLILRPAEGGQTYTAEVGQKGEASFGAVPAGTYSVSFAAFGDWHVSAMTGAGARVAERSVEIRGPDPVRLQVLVARGAGSVNGFAMKEGKGLAGALVVLVPVATVFNVDFVRRDQSDSDGSFALPNIVPGKYVVVAIENGWDLDSARPEVMKKYLARGVRLQVAPNGKYNVEVEVQ